MHWAALITVTAGLLAGADSKDDAKKDLEKFQGKWEAVKLVRGGESMPEEQVKPLRLVITGDKRVLKVGEEVHSDATFKLDASKKPKTIDITVKEGPLEGKTVKGIYTFEGDTHKICLTLEGDERPKDFESKEGSNHLLMIFKRAKDKADEKKDK